VEEKFRGKICSFCRTAFQDGDDIVVCPDCGIPHHRDCWAENGGCSTFGCSQTVFEEASIQPKAVICAQCGAPIGDEFSFCIRCGAKKPEPPQVRYCTCCGGKLYEGYVYCMSCGQPVSQIVIDSYRTNDVTTA
jgi:predicted amidophosphoribosyltransferase